MSTPENKHELETLKKELEIATAKIREFRNRAEQAVSRAELAEKAKVAIEEQLRKWIEQKQRRNLLVENLTLNMRTTYYNISAFGQGSQHEILVWEVLWNLVWLTFMCERCELFLGQRLILIWIKTFYCDHSSIILYLRCSNCYKYVHMKIGILTIRNQPCKTMLPFLLLLIISNYIFLICDDNVTTVLFLKWDFNNLTL